MKACVIGYPLAHTLSPLIHTHWIGQCGIAGSYDARPISSDDLQEGIADLQRESYDGFNVTVPHKIKVRDLCVTLDDAARAIGAVNTVRFERGALHGYNTDSYGFMRALEAYKMNWVNVRALILGAGGAARAVCHALREKKVAAIFITNRTRDRADMLAGACGGASLAWDQARIVPSDINMVVNCTILGMAGAPSLPIDLSKMAAGGIVYDLVYTPLETPLLQQARKYNLQAVSGIDMLLHQAARAFEIWTGHMPVVDDALRRKITALWAEAGR